MKYKFWEKYDFISQDLAVLFDKRLQVVISKLEDFFYLAKIDNYEYETIDFIIAGSCIKADKFRDIDVFIRYKENLENISKNISEKYFKYVNNSKTYFFDNEIIQLVHRERFIEKSLQEIVDIFDFHSTKIAFSCRLDTKTFKIELLDSCIKKEFIEYVISKKNGLININSNPFVSLQRALSFIKRGDDISFETILNIVEKICEIKDDKDIEKYMEKLQGDDEKLNDVKVAIRKFMSKR